ncbi:MAG: hypothetical protein P4L45_16105 [Ignavibacteriaceae bacterium]|nr:hypothetical protein [Ignavibacteriaceae bacterium]
MKKLIIILIIGFSAVFAQKVPIDKARGVFISVGVGPRLPVSSFASSTDIGYGFDVEIDYSDNEFFPVFLFGKIGFDQYPGAQSYYESTDYSNFSTNSLPISLGAKYYFPPLVENIVLFMPVVEFSANYEYMQKLHQFKPASGKSNNLEDISKLGFSAGAGFSMFMLEIMVSYNYLQNNQYISADLKVRLPLYISL